MADKNNSPDNQPSEDRQIQVDRDVVNSNVVTGDNNIVSIHNTNSLSPTERLRAFEQTNECARLLSNPDKIGFTSILWPVLLSTLSVPLFGWVLVQTVPVLLSEMEFSFWWLAVAVGNLCLLGLIAAQFFYGISHLPTLMKGTLLIEASPVRCIPVIVVRHSRLFGKINTVTLETVQGKRLEPIPHADIDAAMLSDGDIGVAYLRKDAVPGSYTRTAIRLVGFKHCAEAPSESGLDEQTLIYIRQLWLQGDRIQAIREYRKVTGTGVTSSRR